MKLMQPSVRRAKRRALRDSKLTFTDRVKMSLSTVTPWVPNARIKFVTEGPDKIKAVIV